MTQNRFLSELVKGRKYAALHESFTITERTAIENGIVGLRHKSIEEWPKKLTYYCKLDIAKAVIAGGTIWVTDVKKMNDRSELTFATDYLAQKIEYLSSMTEFPVGLVEAVKESLNAWMQSEEETKGTKIYRDKFVMAMCLSSMADDANMWRDYGDAGRGVAIHFNKNRLFLTNISAGKFTPGASAAEVGMAEVCYPADGCECLENLLREALAAFEETRDQLERDFIHTLLHSEILRLLMGHKHPSFSSEHEYRIFTHVLAEKTWAGSDYVFEFDNKNRKFHYMDIQLPAHAIGVSQEEFWSDLISGVTVGPNTDDKVGEKIQTALAARGIGDRITRSRAPLRG